MSEKSRVGRYMAEENFQWVLEKTYTKKEICLKSKEILKKGDPLMAVKNDFQQHQMTITLTEDDIFQAVSEYVEKTVHVKIHNPKIHRRIEVLDGKHVSRYSLTAKVDPQ